MSLVRHKYPLGSHHEPRAGRVTLFLLVIVVVTAFMALTFGDAGGGLL